MNLQKYIVILWQGREQPIVFPAHVGHAAVAKYLMDELGKNLKILSAGFWSEDDTLWVGSSSTSLDLESRPQDRKLMETFLKSADRHLWDLCAMYAMAYRKKPELAGPGGPQLSM